MLQIYSVSLLKRLTFFSASVYLMICLISSLGTSNVGNSRMWNTAWASENPLREGAPQKPENASKSPHKSENSDGVEEPETTLPDVDSQGLAPKKEMVLEVAAKRRHPIYGTGTSPTSRTEIHQELISTLPQGDEVSLSKLLAVTTPGMVQGAFGQNFVRGSHGNIQYQIDGVQLPDSPSNSFGQVFSPRNIDHMEIITGGIPAEYGQRLNAIANITTKSGPETPEGEIQLNYGSYNTISPHLLYGGSNSSGDIHYFFSANYNSTERGLDTPQPRSLNDQTRGGTESVHNQASGHSEFARVDWMADNANKFTFTAFNSMSDYQIPNYPCSFSRTDPFFQPGFEDQFGNGGDPDSTTFNYVPCSTNDRQFEANTYFQTAWKHTFSPQSFFQLAPYYKYSAIRVDNDPKNDLAISAGGSTPIAGSTPTSFAENRHTNHLGLKGDYSLRASSQHLLKTGFQVQGSRSDGFISVQTDLAAPAFTDSAPATGYLGGLYVQDEFTIAKPLILVAGIRWDATQFFFSDLHPSDSLLQPRVGLTYLATDTTKLHWFYGKLFQPSPLENLRSAFTTVGGGQLTPYDIKAQKDDYFETGLTQALGEFQSLDLNLFYKDSTNVFDHAQLLNTSIAQPFNFATGYSYGLELSLRGKIAEDWTNFANYSYTIARGKGISGGFFAFPAGSVPGDDYQMMDHVQVHTANAGIAYDRKHFWWSTQGIFGSGLRTGPNNSISLPSHLTFDTTIGYRFADRTREKTADRDWLSRLKASVDVINIFDNAYPITIANGYNGSHYAAGRMFYLRLTQEL